MNNKNISSNDSYLPVAWEYREVAEEEIEKARRGKIFFFNQDNQVDEVLGSVIKLEEKKAEGVFLLLDNGIKIRLDRVITLFGKVGAAYDEYDAYGNSCMDCTGG
ncbi:hypothetical protein H8B06_01560 [Sphingobacterium sp. DN00404]|uniref:Uncharacterized protein n=1 Tax=Sphingobacterium micropteri TaxID=2763501 RepID=A0ABR7YJN7_9SPHI|nr:hypothetical protein [Sphingobacterium micropteri]MBD1431497.1 hypothetical protein [Sphingobacterium micropteri]